MLLHGLPPGAGDGHEDRPYTVCRPVSETCYKTCYYTVCRQEQRTCYKKVPYTVSVPVTCTVMQPQQYTTMVPVKQCGYKQVPVHGLPAGPRDLVQHGELHRLHAGPPHRHEDRELHGLQAGPRDRPCKEVRYTVCRPVQTTSYKTVCETSYQTVTETGCRTVQEEVCVPRTVSPAGLQDGLRAGRRAGLHPGQAGLRGRLLGPVPADLLREDRLSPPRRHRDGLRDGDGAPVRVEAGPVHDLQAGPRAPRRGPCPSRPARWSPRSASSRCPSPPAGWCRRSAPSRSPRRSARPCRPSAPRPCP